jgi:hypothetical protein
VSVTRFPKGLHYRTLKSVRLNYNWLKPKAATTISAVCQQKPGAATWVPPLEELERCLEGARGAEAIITVSNHFVRYSVLPAQKDITNPAELNTYAEFHMREVFGERAAAWILSMGAWDPCYGGVCAAVDRELFEQLEELATRRKVRLQYIEPYLTSAFDRFRKRFPDTRSWFAVVEEGRLCLALLEHGAWQHIRNRRIGHDLKDELLAALDQEAILFPGSKGTAGTVYLLAPAYPELILPEDCGWRTVWLQAGPMAAPSNVPALPGTGEASTCAASG